MKSRLQAANYSWVFKEILSWNRTAAVWLACLYINHDLLAGSSKTVNEILKAMHDPIVAQVCFIMLFIEWFQLVPLSLIMGSWSFDTKNKSSNVGNDNNDNHQAATDC